jgi:hypothetical protein
MFVSSFFSGSVAFACSLFSSFKLDSSDGTYFIHSLTLLISCDVVRTALCSALNFWVLFKQVPTLIGSNHGNITFTVHVVHF